MTTPSTSGTAVRDLRWALEEIAGSDTVGRALDDLPGDARRAFVEATPLSWVPLTVTTQVVDRVAEQAGLDPERMVDQAIRMATTRTMKTLWRVLLRFVTDQALIQRTPLLYRRTRNVGKLEVVSIERGSAELRLSEWPQIPARQARILAVNIETVLGLTGRRDVQCHFKRTEDGALYRITWRSAR